MPDPDREIRQAPDQAEFDKITFKTDVDSTKLAGAWKRLSQKRYTNQFYPSMGSRLTPISGKYPCVYIAISELTTIGEVWGDRMWARRAAKKPFFSIPAVEAALWGYLDVKMLSDPRLCDLTDPETRNAVGLESGTVYHTYLTVTQTWAERIANHPLRVDGILYRSRHTEEYCIVAWSRGDGSVEAKFQFTDAGDFENSASAYAYARSMNLALSFP